MFTMNGKGELQFIGTVEEAGEQKARIRIFPKFIAGLRGIESFSHVIILYWIHLHDNDDERRVLQVFPRRHSVNFEVGVFACRSPTRPNPIGLCVTELIKCEEGALMVRGLDAMEGSPVIDIKPYLPRTDSMPGARTPEWTTRGPPT
jgi:tRNA-Thr(GGU) m(6)t(6)A37 methyltransferase TsaA